MDYYFIEKVIRRFINYVHVFLYYMLFKYLFYLTRKNIYFI